jgi:hypothetical protein
LYAPLNHVRNLRNEVIHACIQMSILFRCKKEICICIKIRSLVIKGRLLRYRTFLSVHKDYISYLEALSINVSVNKQFHGRFDS